MVYLIAARPQPVYDWAAHPYWYNVLHPWHWLTYGNNGTAAATAAVLIYTYLTYQMARTSQNALKASYRPMIAVAKDTEEYTFRVQNIGTGPALGVRVKVVHLDNPSGPSEGSWFKGISAVTPIDSIQGLPMGKEAACTFSIPDHLRNDQFTIVATCWDMTRIFHQSMAFFPYQREWTSREMDASLFSQSGMWFAYASSLHPANERKMVYYWFPGFQLIAQFYTTVRWFIIKFETWREGPYDEWKQGRTLWEGIVEDWPKIKREFTTLKRTEQAPPRTDEPTPPGEDIP